MASSTFTKGIGLLLAAPVAGLAYLLFNKTGRTYSQYFYKQNTVVSPTSIANTASPTRPVPPRPSSEASKVELKELFSLAQTIASISGATTKLGNAELIRLGNIYKLGIGLNNLKPTENSLKDYDALKNFHDQCVQTILQDSDAYEKQVKSSGSPVLQIERLLFLMHYGSATHKNKSHSSYLLQEDNASQIRSMQQVNLRARIRGENVTYPLVEDYEAITKRASATSTLQQEEEEPVEDPPPPPT